MYVGELCRYLVQAPMTREESLVKSSGRLRFAKGLGMSTNVWRKVRERFNLEVYEYYSSSEVRDRSLQCSGLIIIGNCAAREL
jgi:hypothetical protein